MSDTEHEMSQVRVTLEARPDRALIPHGASVRHVDYRIQVSAQSDRSRASRAALTLALVIDRSGSMSGDKIITAKRAALAVLDQLDERDTVSVVVFDDEITTIQAAARVTPALKAHVTGALDGINARGSTALHEGWLTGCESITGENAGERAGLARLFLLTDGMANIGVVDPEQIATQAAGIRRNAGIGTSTFGIGEDYAEELLGPMAEAGGGQFHNLRGSAEIARAFAGELGELLLTAAGGVRIEIEAEPGATVEMVSAYYAAASAEPGKQSITIGDLIGGEERHILARLRFPMSARREEQVVRARVLWTVDGVERATEWSALRFAYASDAECDAEAPDVAVTHRVGESLSDRAQREALTRSKRGDVAGARAMLAEASAMLTAAIPVDPALQQEMDEIQQLDANLARGPLPSASSKEAYFQKQMRSRGQRDLR